jgi:hypothetical protein
LSKGEIDSQALKRIFNEIEKTIRPLVSGKVFLDLEEASLNIRPAALHAIANQLELHIKDNPIKMAVVASKFDRCGRLHLLCELLCSRGLRVAMFITPQAPGRG